MVLATILEVVAINGLFHFFPVLASILELVGQLASSGYEEAENRREPVDRIPREALLTVALLLVVDRIPRECHSATCPTFRLLPKPLFLKQKGNRKPERFLGEPKAQADPK